MREGEEEEEVQEEVTRQGGWARRKWTKTEGRW